jgi:BlaI family transcriptional regulator, penicillinase repressor
MTHDISDAEWIVMRVIWETHPITSQDVVDALAARHHWSPRTVRTMLNRLVKKKALGFKTEGKRYLYYPKAKQADCVKQESRSFLSRVFGGSVAPMLAHFVDQAELSEEEMRQLKEILNRKKGK